MGLGYLQSLSLSVGFGLCFETVQLHPKRKVRLVGNARLVLEGRYLTTSLVEVPLELLLVMLQTRRLRTKWNGIEWNRME